MNLKSLLMASALALPAFAAQAEPVKIGFMATLSGPSAALGVHMRNGFQLGMKELGNTLGGQPAEVIVVDDELKPDVGVAKAKGLIERDKVDVLTGIVFSNVMMAVSKVANDAGTITISTNAGPSPLAGKGCTANFFQISTQNDMNHEVMGKYAQDKGFKRVVLMAPNYQAGKDALAGFKRFYKGEVVDEMFTQLGQLDFSAEIAKISAASPDAIFTFMPGGMGVALVKQYDQAGLSKKIPFLSAFTVDETTLPATKEAAEGMFSGAQWAPNLDNAENKAFVAAYEKEFGAPPSLYASQGYDLAKLLDGALKATGGKVSDKAALRDAIAKAPFKSVRGAFKFNRNGFPVQDQFVVKAVKRADGQFVTESVAKVFTAHQDAYVGECPLK
ncbi:MAG: ABC transporter substrate-binding protein [Proteobacteria bacterium]|nr:ABC transporter substrate-binding protein [Pseudomonadota bacterium]